MILKTKFASLVVFAITVHAHAASPFFDVRDYGAVGDGKTIDSPAINEAIQAASDSGGGTVFFPAGVYASYTIRLESHITLHLDNGATLLAAYPSQDGSLGYDAAEPNVWGDEHRYQDFGHSHWKNSLIWGANLNDVSIVGQGLIDGRALGGTRPILLPGETLPPHLERARAEHPGMGNKAIALKNCRNVTLRDFSMFRCGHFALLATGVDNLTIENLRVDTNRDAFDIDACRNVRIANCFVNTPKDDAIVLKSSYALGEARATENVTIIGCQVSGYAVGSLLDGTFDRSFERAPDRDGPTGRIKFGTESNGGFKNITIGDCVFDRSRGLALEIVDGGVMEDVSISNLTMRDIVNAPIFIRLGNRARGPEGTPVGTIRRIAINNVVVSNADSRYASQIVGLQGNPIEDVSFNNIWIQYRGGISMQQVAEQPEELVNSFFLRGDEAGVRGPREPYAVPARETAYPEPSMFGLLPAYGLYARHVDGLTLKNVRFELMKSDERPAVVLDTVSDAVFNEFRADSGEEAPLFEMRNVREIQLRNVRELEDQQIEATNQLSLFSVE